MFRMSGIYCRLRVLLLVQDRGPFSVEREDRLLQGVFGPCRDCVGCITHRAEASIILL